MSGVVRRPFGRAPDGTQVEAFDLTHGAVSVTVIGYGAVLQSVRVPDRDGVVGEVVLGYDDLAGYLADEAFLGAVVGRFANRIAGGRFSLDGREHVLPQNHGRTTLHGGPDGFHAQVWDAEPVTSGVRLRLHSPDGDMGFPGALEVDVTVTLGDAGLRWDYRATTDRATVVNLTNHAYWNLRGAPGAGTVEDHEVLLHASRYVPVDAGLVPLPALADVAGTVMDFREPRRVGDRLRSGDPQLVHAQGYDHCWVLDGERTGGTVDATPDAGPDDSGAPPPDLPLAARVHEPVSGRVLEVRTDQPGVQLYSGNFLDGSVVGRAGCTLRQGDGLCLETEHLPDSPNRPDFPSTVLRPGEVYATSTAVRFDVS